MTLQVLEAFPRARTGLPPRARPRADQCVAGRWRAFREGCRKWPTVSLSFRDFSRHLDGLGLFEAVPRYAADLYLCAACTLGSEVACRAIQATYFPMLRGPIVRFGRSSDFVEDVLQAVGERLFVQPRLRIATYRGNGALGPWLRTVALRAALDRRRSLRLAHRLEQRVEQEALDRLAPQHPATDPAGFPADWIGVVRQAFDEAAHALSAEDRWLLRSFYFESGRVEALCRQLELDRSSVYRRLRRCEGCLRDRVVKQTRTKLGIADKEELVGVLRASGESVDLVNALRAALEV